MTDVLHAQPDQGTPILRADEVDQVVLADVRDFLGTLPPDSPLTTLLVRQMSALSRGIDIASLESDAELTPNQAAEILRMSRPFLLKFLDSGELPSHSVGSHRRIRMSDLTEFAQRRDAARATVADALGNDRAIMKKARARAATLTDAHKAELDAL